MAPGSAAVLGTRDVQGRFYRREEEFGRASWVPSIAMMVDSDQEIETYPWLGENEPMSEWEGERPYSELEPYSYTIRNRRFSTVLRVREQDLRRDKTGQLDVRISEVAMKAAHLPQKELSTLLNTVGNAYDGQAFYKADRVKGKAKVTINNDIQHTLPGALANIEAADVAKAILKSVKQLHGMKDDHGEPMNGSAMEFMIQSPVELWDVVVAALENEYLANGVTNTIPHLNYKFVPVVNPRLTATDQLHTFVTDQPLKALIWQDEVESEMDHLGKGSDHYFKFQEHLFGVLREGNGGYGRPEMACRTTLVAGS